MSSMERPESVARAGVVSAESGSTPYSWSMMAASRLDMRIIRQRAVAMVSTSLASVEVEGLNSA